MGNSSPGWSYGAGGKTLTMNEDQTWNLWHGRSPPLGKASEPGMRYAYASAFAKGAYVLDVGCGPGEGTQVLNEFASATVGVDASSVAVRYAQTRFGRVSDNIMFVVASGEHLPFRPGTFGVATAFEVIEHVEDANALLQNLKEVLCKGGRLIVSTPNKTFSSPGLKHPLTYWHTREYYPEEFMRLLDEHFDRLETAGVVGGERRSRLNRGPFYTVLRLVDAMPAFANKAARRFLSSRPGYAALDLVYGNPDSTRIRIERGKLMSAYCIICVCKKRRADSPQTGPLYPRSRKEGSIQDDTTRSDLSQSQRLA